MCLSVNDTAISDMIAVVTKSSVHVCFEIYGLHLEFYGTIKNYIFKDWGKILLDAIK